MTWNDVGDWLKENAGSTAALVGSLLTGNVPAAVAAGVSMVAGATGHAEPGHALAAFQSDPATMVKLKELAVQDEQNIREHIRSMEELRLKDLQHQHSETQTTIRNSDNSEDPVVRRTRPYQSWLSLLAAILYVIIPTTKGMTVDIYILGALLTLPWSYAGLRQAGKAMDAFAQMKVGVAKGAK